MKTIHLRLTSGLVRRSTVSLVMICFVAFFSTSCNKKVDNLLRQSYPDSTALADGKGRVLYIAVDGLRGGAVQSIAPPNIIKLYPNSLFSYNNLASYLSSPAITNATGWANMTTAVDLPKHQVATETFAGNNLANYPSFITRIKSVRQDLAIATFSSSSAFHNNLTTGADSRQVFNDDISVKNAALIELKNGSSNLVLAQFHGAETAGAAGNFDETNVSYKSAILTIDGYIGELITTLQARPNYALENWMVVIVSNKGGSTSTSATDGTAFTDNTRNNFILYYSPRFTTRLINRPAVSQATFQTNAARFRQQSPYFTKAQNATDTLYNIGNANSNYIGDITVQFSIKMDPSSGGFTDIFSKKGKNVAGTQTNIGWTIQQDGQQIRVGMTPASGSGISKVSPSGIGNNIWRSIVVVMRRTAATDNIMRLYIDGTLVASDSVRNASGTMAANCPLIIGNNPVSTSLGVKSDVNIAYIKIFRRAFTALDVATLGCKTAVDSTHPYFSDLIGYWPCDEIGQSVLTERTGKGSNFNITGIYEWATINEYSVNLCPPILPSFYRQVPNAVDVPVQVMQWFGIVVPSNWNLDGIGWTPNFK